MSTISVRTHFAAGHRILGLVGAGAKCRNIHGHTFHVTWTFEQSKDNFSLEFGTLKQALRGVIKDNFDHSFIVDQDDPFSEYLRLESLKHYVLAGKPTTEAIAEEIANLSAASLKAVTKHVVMRRVALEEGPNNVATWEDD